MDGDIITDNYNKYQKKLNLLECIKQSAKIYKSDLVGNKFMYIFDGRYIEVIYKKSNFKHLTGVNSNLSADKFYQLAVKNMLAANQIWFDTNHPYDLCMRKAQHLNNIKELTLKENFLLEEIGTNSHIYKFGSTNSKFTICFGYDKGKNGELNQNIFIPMSLRDEDCFNRSKAIYKVTHILSKKNNSKFYDTVSYMAKGYSLSDIPEEIKEKIQIIGNTENNIHPPKPKRLKIVFHRPESKSNGHER